MKAPTRMREVLDGVIRYRWVETGPLDHYRHAHAFDYLCADIARRNPPAAMVCFEGPELESVRLARELGYLGCGSNGWLTHHWPRRGSY